MSFSLPGTDLYYLARDNLSPEEYERIMPPEKAWHMIRRDFFFSDTPPNNGFIVNMHRTEYVNFRDQAPAQGLREENKMLHLLQSGAVVMLDRYSSLGEVFFINKQRFGWRIGKFLVTVFPFFIRCRWFQY